MTYHPRFEALKLRVSSTKLATDKDSIREYDRDQRLHVDLTNISKANVCEYFGREIPRAKELGLDPGRKYRLLRHPDELKKGAKTFNGIQVLMKHIPVNADDHQPYDTVGATGTDAVFRKPYLLNTLTIWARRGIEAVESESQKELSCAYHYDADMTPGTYEGEPYEGVMRNIVGNHVALVSEGRAGPDVVVGDSMENLRMKATLFVPKGKVLTRRAAAHFGALNVYLKPRLAFDAKVDALPILKATVAKKTTRQKIIDAISAATVGKLAQDATLEDITSLLDALEDSPISEGADTANEETSGLPVVGKGLNMAKAKDKKPAMDAEGLKEFMKGKMSEDDYKTACDMMGEGEEAEDAEEEEEKKEKEKEKKEGEDKRAKDAEPGEKEEKKEEKKEGEDADPKEQKDVVTAKAMDEAISAAVAAVERRNKATREAVREVAPYVGTLAMDHSTPEDVYATALAAFDVKVDKAWPLSAMKALLKAQPKPGASNPRRDQPMATDAKSKTAYDEMFPDAKRIVLSA